MKATKWTIALVALLLALACVFAACGKKDEPAKTDDKPADTTPAPVDDKPAEPAKPAVSRDELNKIAEGLKEDYAKEFVDLYTAQTKIAIEGELAETLLKIQGAESATEAQKLADDFIEFLRGQKTLVDAVAELLAKLGDEITLADDDTVKELNDYNTQLNNAYYGSNEAKKAVLEAYKADKDTQKQITDANATMIALRAAKIAADTALTGENAKIADVLKAFQADGKAFNLKDQQQYQALVETLATWAALYNIKVDSAAYNEILDVDKLAQAKTLLDAGIAKNADVVNALKLIDTYKALRAKAEELRYKEFIDVDTTDLLAATDTTHTVLVKTAAGNKWATPTVAATAKADDIAKVEKVLATDDYKLVLKETLEAADKAVTLWSTTTSESVKVDIGYYDTTAGAVETVRNAVLGIGAIKTAYTASVGRALTAFGNFETTLYVDVVPTKADTTATWAGFTSDPKKTGYTTTLADEITAVKATFKKLDTDGVTRVSFGGGLLASTGDYTVTDSSSNNYKVVLEGGKPAITYTAWTYAYQLKTAGDLLGAVKFDLLGTLTAGNVTKSEAAVKFLTMYIGEGEYADSYDFDEYKGYAAGFAGKALVMKDQAITEVATSGVVEIKGADVNVAKSAAVEAKVLSPYTIAVARIDMAKKIADAKKAALDELKAAALALRTAGDADAVAAVDELYTGVANGKYLNAKFNGEDALAANDALYAQAITTEKVEVKPESEPGKGDNKTVTILALINDAKAAVTAVKAIAAPAAALAPLNGAKATLAAAEAALKENADMIAIYDQYIANAKAALDAATAGKTANLEDKVAAATTAYTKVSGIKNLLLNKVAFDDANSGSALVAGLALGAANEAANTTAINGVIGAFAGDVPAADQTALETYLGKLAAETQSAKNTLEANVATTKAALETAVKAYAGTTALTPAAANTDKVAINAAITAIKTFATNNEADYINLKAAYAYGDTTITVDYLTEAAREQILANTYATIDAVITYAQTLDTTYSITPAAKTAKYILDTETDPDGDSIATETWKSAAQNRVKEYKVVVETVTSLAAADKLIKDYAVDETIYNFADAVKLINQALTAAGKPTITLADLKKAL